MPIGFVVLLTIVQNVLIVALVGILAKGVGSWYLENMQASMSGAAQAPVTSLPDGFGIAFIVVLVIGLFGYAVQAIGLGQIALRRSSVGSALADGVSGAAKNLLPLLVMALVAVAACIVLALAGRPARGADRRAGQDRRRLAGRGPGRAVYHRRVAGDVRGDVRRDVFAVARCQRRRRSAPQRLGRGLIGRSDGA